jgi:hypothetical protein
VGVWGCVCVCRCVCVDSVMTEVFLNLCVDFVMTEVFLNLTEFLHPWLRGFRAFSSVVKQMPGYTRIFRRGTARTFPHSFFFCYLCCSMYFYLCCSIVLFVCKCVLPPGDNTIAVNKYNNNKYTTKCNWIFVLLTKYLLHVSPLTAPSWGRNLVTSQNLIISRRFR